MGRTDGSAEIFLGLIERFKREISSREVFSREDRLTPLQLFALGFIFKKPGASAQELGKYLELSPSSIAQLTRRMLRGRLVIRRTDSVDRRTIRFTITRHGKRKFERSHRERARLMRRILRFIPRKDLRSLIRIFTNLLSLVEKRNVV